jgi:hypothetical protein
LCTALLFSGCGAENVFSSEEPAETAPPSNSSTPTTEPAPTDAPTDAQPQKPEGMAQVFLKRDTDGTDGGFLDLIALMEANGEPFYDLIESDDVVLLFYNCQWTEHGGTNTDLIKSVAQAIHDHPDGFTGEIVVADSGQGDGSLDHQNANSLNRDQSVLDVVNELKTQGVKISGYLWDDIMDVAVAEFSEGDDTDGYIVSDTVSESTRLAVSYVKFTTEYGTKISFKQGIWDGGAYDSENFKVISMPVLKSHATYMCSAAVKNYMGAPSTSLSSAAGGSPHHSVGLGGMGEMMAKTRLPVLNILDMIHIGSRRGPTVRYDESTTCNMIAASTDPFALDFWAVKNVLIPEAEKVGNPNLTRMSPEAEEPGSFGYWMNLSLDELEKEGFDDFVFTEDRILLVE